jgi:crotonobetainyl-CoA:carnitine CoA-transferase CaiB-like acyl-CoA transferase
MNETVNHNRPLPLEGLLVIDLTRLLPGPLCTMLMGDYGAEVIKIEDVEAGDPTRFVGFSCGSRGSFFRQLNRNKKSLALNLKRDEGLEIVMKLAARADVLVEGFRPGVMDRLGLGYDKLFKVNEKIIYASISGYGQDGPYRERAGHDLNYTALAGLLDLSASKDGKPVMPAIQLADIGGGSMMALNGILIALFQRSQTGRGCYVDAAMTRGILPWLTYAASSLESPEEMPRRGCGHITGAYACYNIYETADGKFMSLGALEPVFWQRFCKAVGREKWAELQFDWKGRENLIKETEKIFRGKTRQEWEVLFASIDACCEPVLNLEEAIDHPISRAGGYWIDYSVENGETEKLTGFPLLFSGQSGELRLSPPSHGEHTEEIMQSLGYSSSAVLKLKESGIVKTAV